MQEILISPELLRLHNIPVVKLVQYPGEFVINYPGAYHSGFNHGYNCAESTNFATSAWLPIGALARSCDCRQDSVKIQVIPELVSYQAKVAGSSRLGSRHSL